MVRSRFALCFMIVVTASAYAQTASDLAGKYHTVAAYKVRPGILMTAQYAEDGRVCKLILQRYYMPNQTDADSTIPGTLRDQLIDELVPAEERGLAASGRLNNSFVAGGFTHTERDFENVLIVIDGAVSEGDKIVIIHWKNRTCPSGVQ